MIRQVADAHNLAFDNIALQQHTDFTYIENVPDVALFHCIRVCRMLLRRLVYPLLFSGRRLIITDTARKNADTGGDSLWTDSFALAEELRRTDPEAFELLATTEVDHIDLTDKWDMRATHPTIEL